MEAVLVAKYRKIDPRIWTDEGFGNLDAGSQLAAFYVLAGPNTLPCGVALPNMYAMAGVATNWCCRSDIKSGVEVAETLSKAFGWPMGTCIYFVFVV